MFCWSKSEIRFMAAYDIACMKGPLSRTSRAANDHAMLALSWLLLVCIPLTTDF